MADTGTKRIFINTASMTITRIMGLLVGFVVTPITIHELGLSNYGLWAILNGVMGYFTLLDFGVGSTFMTQFAFYYTEGNRRGIREVMSFGAIFYLLLGLLFFPFAALIAPRIIIWFHVEFSEIGMIEVVFWWIYSYLFLSQIFGGFSTLINASQRMVLTSIIGFIAQILNYIILVSMLLLHKSLYSFVIANFVTLFFTSIITYFIARSILGQSLFCAPWSISWSTIKSLLSFGGWMQLTNLSVQVNMETDRVLIGHFVNTETVGVYQLANKLAILSRYLPLTILSAMLPNISSKNANGKTDGILHAYIDGTKYLALLTLFITGFLLSDSDPIQVLWLGQVMLGLTPIMALLLLPYIINNLTGVGTTILRALARPRLESYYMVGGALLNILITIALAPMYGLWGILYGTLIGMSLSSIYFIIMFHSSFQIPWWNGFFRDLIKIIFATVGAGLISLFVWKMILIQPTIRVEALVALVASGIVYTIIFFLMILLMRFFSHRDIERVQGLFYKKSIPTFFNMIINFINLYNAR